MLINERRSESKIQPNLFLALQIISMLLLSYVLYVIFYGLGASSDILIFILSIANIYAYNKFFTKYKRVLQRSKAKKTKRKKF